MVLLICWALSIQPQPSALTLNLPNSETHHKISNQHSNTASARRQQDEPCVHAQDHQDLLKGSLTSHVAGDLVTVIRFVLWAALARLEEKGGRGLGSCSERANRAQLRHASRLW